MEVNVTLKGGLFTGDIPRIVRKQIEHEILSKVEERVQRGGKGLGAKRNAVTGARQNFTDLQMSSTRGGKEHWPRMSGASWQRKNIGIIKAMAPRVGAAAARRIAEELGS